MDAARVPAFERGQPGRSLGKDPRDTVAGTPPDLDVRPIGFLVVVDGEEQVVIARRETRRAGDLGAAAGAVVDQEEIGAFVVADGNYIGMAAREIGTERIEDATI